MPGRGRPSKFNDKMRKSMQFLAKKGFTIDEIAEALCIDRGTVYNWQNKYDDFFNALKEWKEAADRNVERSLYERACGFKCIDTKFATHEGIITDQKEYTKHYPPDTTAAIFWLKNRQRQKWSDRKEIDHHVGAESDDELDNRIRALMRDEDSQE